jgi:hypothetical protein
MAKIHADPDDLRDFAALLDHTVEQVRDSRTNILSGLNDLHHDWRDANYSKFDQSFKETLARLESFFKKSEEFSRELRRQAAHLQSYLDSK